MVVVGGGDSCSASQVRGMSRTEALMGVLAQHMQAHGSQACPVLDLVEPGQGFRLWRGVCIKRALLGLLAKHMLRHAAAKLVPCPTAHTLTASPLAAEPMSMPSSPPYP
jgi:hypothetical protein